MTTDEKREREEYERAADVLIGKLRNSISLRTCDTCGDVGLVSRVHGPLASDYRYAVTWHNGRAVPFTQPVANDFRFTDCVCPACDLRARDKERH